MKTVDRSFSFIFFLLPLPETSFQSVSSQSTISISASVKPPNKFLKPKVSTAEGKRNVVFEIGRSPNKKITASLKFCSSPADIFMGCKVSKKDEETPRVPDFTKLASETHFSLSEVEALHELFKKLSSSLVNDGNIQKEELMLGLFRSSNKQNLFADRIFDLFDVNRNGHIEFGEFVRSLSTFHPRTPEAEKIAYAFRLYDLRRTGYIEREELKQMVLALLTESELNLSDDIVEAIVDKTFKEVDKDGDGRIDEEEWKEYAAKNPLLLRNMTLPYLMDVTLAFPSFVMHTEADESELAK